MKLWTAVFAVTVIVCFGAGAASAAKPEYRVYGSCANHKPFRPAHRCGYDRPRAVRATFVFESHVGKRKLKVCQKIYGIPLNKRHDCVKAKGTFAYKSIPFLVTGVRAKIRVRVVFYVAKPGSGRYVKAGTSGLRFDP